MGWFGRKKSIEQLEAEARAWDSVLKSDKYYKPGGTIAIGGSSEPLPTGGFIGELVEDAHKRGGLEAEFRQEMAQAMTEDDQERVFNKFVQKVRVGRAGYGGQPLEKARARVLKMWFRLLGEEGG